MDKDSHNEHFGTESNKYSSVESVCTTHRDVPDGVIDNILNALNTQRLDALSAISSAPNGTSHGDKA